MMDFAETPRLVSPVLLCAFEGWNDAAGAATGLLDHLLEVWDAKLIATLDPEDYYDFQVNRPVISTDDAGMRQLSWPSTQLFVARPPAALHDVVIVRGIEPNVRWRSFVAELLAAADDLDVRLVVTLGALLAETPHTRPIKVSGTATEVDLEDRLNLSASTYEGPTGIVGVIQDACARVDLPAVSYWAAVPHYLPQAPNPKATLALLAKVEDLLDLRIALGDLPDESRAWDRGVAEMTEDEEEIADYVRSLEESHDTADLPEASGEEIAREFERYLKRRDKP